MENYKVERDSEKQEEIEKKESKTPNLSYKGTFQSSTLLQNQNNFSECIEEESSSRLQQEEYSKKNQHRKWLHYGCFPIEYIIDHFKEGSIKGAVITMVICILCSGTASLPYLALRNGVFLSALYIIFGAVISYFCGMLLISCAETIGRDKYEDFARYCYGRKMEVFTGITNLITLLGFVVTFIVYLKTLIPSVLETILGKKNTPMLLGEGQWGGELFWATVYSLFLLFPMSIPRKINTFRFASLFGVACTVYLTICFVFIFFCDRNIVPSVKQNLKNASYFNFTFGGLLHALPYVNFNYMYQTNIPIIYRELHHKSYLSMQKIIISASIICIVIYITICSFGYLTLVGNPSGLYVLDSSNDILEVEFDSIPLDIGVISVLLTVIIVSPLCILPAKDTIEDLFFFEEGMSSTNNVIVSFALCILAYLFAVSFPEVGDAITVCGFTTYPLIGFILPCVFYLNIVKEKPITKEIICWIVIVFISVISGVTCYLFAYEKFTGENLIYKQS